MKIELFEEDIPEFSNEMMTLTQVFATFKCGEDLQMARYNFKNQPEIFQNYPQVTQMLEKKGCFTSDPCRWRNYIDW